MDFKNIHVLLLDGSARQTLSILYGLKKLGCHVTVLCSSKLDVCYSSHYPDVKLLCRNFSDVDAYMAQIKEELASGKYDVLMPVSERVTDLITQQEEQLGQYARLACAPRCAYIQAHNKQLTFTRAMESGVPCPLTRKSEESISDYLERAHFPIIIKPRSGMGSIGFKKIDTREQMEALIAQGRVNPEDYVVQEFIPAKTMRGVNIFVADGELKSAVANEVLRRYPVDAGTATLVRSVDDAEAVAYAAKLLCAMGWRGYADVSFLIDDRDGSLKLLEINGRINASVKLYFRCGFDLARQLLELAYGEPITAYPANTRFGLAVRHSQADILWFLRSPNRFSTQPSYFNRKNTRDVVFSMKDPLPYLTYTLQHIKTMKDYKKKRDRRI